MSLEAMGYCWRVRGLTCAQKLVLLALANRHNPDTGQCNPSLDRLAEDVGITRRNVINHVNALVDAGHIVREHKVTTTGYKASQYRFPGVDTITTGSVGADTTPSVGIDTTPSVGIDTSSETKKETKDSAYPFSSFWEVYPRKVAKPQAEKAWKKLKDKDRYVCLSHIGHRTWPTDKQFIPHPATFLNQRRWEDDLSTGVSGHTTQELEIG